MIYFLLPKTHISTYNNIKTRVFLRHTPVLVDYPTTATPPPDNATKYNESAEFPHPTFISHSLYHYLMDSKKQIHEHDTEWDYFKKYTNPYEYIHTYIPNNKKCVSKYKPISRAYFKMIEIIDTFQLLSSKNNGQQSYSIPSISYNGTYPVKDVVQNNMHFNNKFSAADFEGGIKTFHLAEGPGGFIEAFVNLRKNVAGSVNDKYIGMTIIDKNNEVNVPGWKKIQNFLKENPNIEIEMGKDLTGNLLNIENFEYCVQKYGSSIDYITGDGGFDFSGDYNNQEESILDLLFAQISFALCMQKMGGCFVLKIFDCFTAATVDLLYILSSFYEKVYISKPFTSRYANSEKYLICKNFLFNDNTQFYDKIHLAFSSLLAASSAAAAAATDINKPSADLSHAKCRRFLNIPISNFFITHIEEYNSIFGQQQLENINKTITLIMNNKTFREREPKLLLDANFHEEHNKDEVSGGGGGGGSRYYLRSGEYLGENKYISFGWDKRKIFDENPRKEISRNCLIAAAAAATATMSTTTTNYNDKKNIQSKNYNSSNDDEFIDDVNITQYLDKLTKVNIQKCIQWCVKYNVPY